MIDVFSMSPIREKLAEVEFKLMLLHLEQFVGQIKHLTRYVKPPNIDYRRTTETEINAFSIFNITA